MFKSAIATLVFLFIWAIIVQAQPDRLVRQGNKLYKAEDFAAASEKYAEALEKEPNHVKGIFNLGDANYQAEKYEDAVKKFEEAALLAKQDLVKAHAYHNAGNAYIKANEIEKSIDAYKKSLRLNPSDADTRYNLAFAQAQLQKQQNQDQNQQDKNDQKKEDKQDKQQENKNEQQDQQDQQQNQDQEKPGEQPQPKEGELSKEQAERILKALENDENKVQEEMNKKRMQPVRIKIEKDW